MKKTEIISSVHFFVFQGKLKLDSNSATILLAFKLNYYQ